MRRIPRVLLTAAAVFLLYVFCTGVFPFARQPELPEAEIPAADAYLGTEPCVDRVALVETPEEGLSARVYLLSQAEHTIDLSYYAIHMGDTTDVFLGAILDAADRGIRVRILVDGMFGGLTASNKAAAEAIGSHPNITLRLYNPPDLLRPWTFNCRLHDKYILIDGKLLLLGGRNIGDKYFAPEGFTGLCSLDRDVMVYNTGWESGTEHSVLSAVRDYMDGIWNGDDVQEPFSRPTGRGEAERERLLRCYQTAADGIDQLPPLDLEAATLPANRITFLHNDTGTGPKPPTVARSLFSLLASAEESVTLQSPYVIASENLLPVLSELAERQVACRILTNSQGTSPNLPAFTAYLNDRADLLGTGVELWEYQGCDAIHAKSYLVDGRVAAVGSFNLDPRSTYLDTELLLVIDSEPFAQRLAAVQEDYFAESLALDGSGSYLPGGVSPQPVSTGKRVLTGLLSLPIRLFRYLV